MVLSLFEEHLRERRFHIKLKDKQIFSFTILQSEHVVVFDNLVSLGLVAKEERERLEEEERQREEEEQKKIKEEKAKYFEENNLVKGTTIFKHFRWFQFSKKKLFANFIFYK